MKNKIISAAMLLSALCFGGCGKHHDTKPTPVNYTQISYTGHTYLSEARNLFAAAAAGNKIVFTGGDGDFAASKTGDIYDVKTNTWTTPT